VAAAGDGKGAGSDDNESGGPSLPSSFTPAALGRAWGAGERIVCACCHKQAHEVGVAALLPCDKCKRSFYCGPECARKDWDAGHKTLCELATRVTRPAP
jgi:hypothetical protein